MFDGVIYLRDILNANESRDDTASSILAHPDVQEALEIVLNTKDFKVVNTTQMKFEKNKDARGYEVTPSYKSLSEQNGAEFIYEDTNKEARVLVFFNEMTEKNGGYLYIPNSYKAKCWPTLEIMKSGQFEDSEGLIYPCKRRIIEAKPGSVAVFPGTLWHSKGLNVTNAPTECLVIDVVSN